MLQAAANDIVRLEPLRILTAVTARLEAAPKRRKSIAPLGPEVKQVPRLENSSLAKSSMALGMTRG